MVAFTFLMIAAGSAQPAERDISPPKPGGSLENGPIVLVLHSYHYGFTWSDNVSKGIQSVFDAYKDRIELRYEFMDTRHISSAEYFKQFERMLAIKYSRHRIDAVICSDDHALDFMVNLAPDLFPHTPVVFCSVSSYSADMARARPIAGVLESIDIASTLDIALRQNPQTRTVAVITDRTKTGQALKAKSEDVFERYSDRLRFRYLQDYTIEDLEQVVAGLGNDTIIFLFIFSQDKVGRVFSHEENLKKLARVANVPIYSVWKFYLGSGIVGGKLASGEADGRLAGQIALELLQGKRVADFELKKSPTRYMFDYHLLAKFGIGLENVPANSLVINRPFSFYQNYKGIVWGAAAVFLFCLLVIGFLLTVLAIRRRSERHIQQLHRQQSALLNNIPDLAWLKDRDSRFIAVNEPFANACGADIRNIEGKTDSDVWPKELADRFRSDDFEVLESGNRKKVEESLVHRNGTQVVIETIKSPIYDDSRQVIGTAGIARDITERITTEKKLRESEERFSKLFNASPIWMVLATVEEGRYIEVNDAFLKTAGYSRREVIGRTSTELGLWNDPLERKAIVEKLREYGHIDANPVQFRMKDGSLREFLWSAVVTTMGDKECALSALVDITDLKQAEKEKAKLQSQIVHSQKMEAIGTLAGGIAHDFNNLLMGIQGRAAMITFDLDSSHPCMEHVNAISEYIRSAAKLTKQLLGVARGGKYEVHPIDLNAVVAESAAMFGRTKKEISIHRKFREPPPVAAADRRQIEQVLLNLFVNAWQAMPDGGDLYLETAVVQLDEAYCRSHGAKPGRYARIAVTDTGIGMDEKTRQRVFDPFFTTKEQGRGTGLGLASAFGIVKNHDGIITVYSEVGQGTTVNVYLPVSDQQIRAESDSSPELLKGTETILLVDDEEMILKVGQAFLRRLGYNTIAAKGGRQAIEFVKAWGEKIDLVILDLIMPEMGGEKVFDAVKEIAPTLPVLLSSGYSLNGQADAIMQKGCEGFIQKPFDVQELSQILRRILDREKSNTEK